MGLFALFLGEISLFFCACLYFLCIFEFFVDGGSCEGCCYKN